jgi:hypothetical protein
MFNTANARLVKKHIAQITKTQCRQWHTTLKNTLQSRFLLGAKTFTLRSLLSIPSVKTINKSNICTNNSFIYINISFILINISFIYTFLRGFYIYSPKRLEFSVHLTQTSAPLINKKRSGLMVRSYDGNDNDNVNDNSNKRVSH